MTVEEFAQGPAQSGILTDRLRLLNLALFMSFLLLPDSFSKLPVCPYRETVSLFLHFTVNPKPPVGFLDVPRCSMTGKEQTVCRYGLVRMVRFYLCQVPAD